METETKQVDIRELSEEQINQITQKWEKRFKSAVEFKKPIRAKHLRMYKLYRAYRDKRSYYYRTSLMPPIGFKIVETVLSRLAGSRLRIDINPTTRDQAESTSLQSWEDLVNHSFDFGEMEDKKMDWIWSAVLYGDGIIKDTWDSQAKDPVKKVKDPWELLPAPETIDWDTMPWLIDRTIGSMTTLKRRNQDREDAGQAPLYVNLDKVKGTKVEDWTKERYEINTLKMSQIYDRAVNRGKDTDYDDHTDAAPSFLGDKREDPEHIEIRQCWDYEEGLLCTFFNGILVRYVSNPYRSCRQGRIYIKMSTYRLPWEAWNTAYLEPVETTINEIADTRNHRMDDIVMFSSPIVKARKERVKKADMVFGPGEIWFLEDPELDAIIERPAQAGMVSLNEEQNMKEEINETLAISEYMQGQAGSAQEPAQKVGLLLGQGMQRLMTPSHNLARGYEQLVNLDIMMYKAFLDKDKYYRLVSKDVDNKADQFKQFKQDDLKVQVDAKVEIEPIVPKDQYTRIQELRMLYELLIANGPDEQTSAGQARWLRLKRGLETLIVDELGNQKYSKLLQEVDSEPTPPESVQEPIPAEPPVMPPQPVNQPAMPPQPQEGQPEQASGIRALLQKIPLIKKLT